MTVVKVASNGGKMAQGMNLGNRVKPLRNVAALSRLIRRVNDRPFGLTGMAAFSGPPGFGKSFGCIHCTVAYDAIHISVQELWTKKTLLTEILRELSVQPHRSLAEMMKQVNEGLALANRPLIIDEVDYAIDRGMIKMIRDMHDGSGVPVILVGMEEMPMKLQKWQLVKSRIIEVAYAEPLDLRDTRLLAENYAEGIEIDDSMLEFIRAANKGNAREISNELAYVVEVCRTEGHKQMTREMWGNSPLFDAGFKAPRRGL
ncbi:AAA family ATPase [Roseobacter sp. YSTF-M11]|uniref:AAA family ATPase n=1 Tax=Roseobacter insulae TaxID=2859783 RepID=A0A9X1K2L8_9RHOB|nr:AAA family ATPase [Roseobacter insulae]MBW4708658.1 AAA family ATPase [Roseobacter insulae]